MTDPAVRTRIQVCIDCIDCIDCADATGLAGFWARAIDYVAALPVLAVDR